MWTRWGKPSSHDVLGPGGVSEPNEERQEGQGKGLSGFGVFSGVFESFLDPKSPVLLPSHCLLNRTLVSNPTPGLASLPLSFPYANSDMAERPRRRPRTLQAVEAEMGSGMFMTPRVGVS